MTEPSKKKILVVEDEREILEMISLMIESSLNLVVVESTSGFEAIEILKKDSDFVCIVCDFNMNNGSGGDVFRYLQTTGLKIPFVLCSSHPPADFPAFKEKQPNGFVIKPEIFPALEEQIRKIAAGSAGEVSGSPSESMDSEEFCRIRASTVLSFGLLTCDLYLKLNQKKYIKVMRKGDIFDSSDFSKLSSKKVDFLYIKKGDVGFVLNRMSLDIKKMDEAMHAGTPTLNCIVEVSTATVEVISEFSQIMGFTPEVQELTENAVQLTVKAMMRKPQFSTMFSELFLDPSSYRASHSVVLAYLSCGIAAMLGWNSSIVFYKLVLAALLHDCSLTSDAFSRFQTLDEINEQDPPLDDASIQMFKDHPVRIAQALKTFSEVPPDVETIVRQHHERPDGTGFPLGLDHFSISPLSAVFIVAEDLMYYREQLSPGSHIAGFVNNLGANFYQGSFRRITDAITQSLIDQEQKT